MTKFDEYAGRYDQWFLNNGNLLESEVRLVAYFLEDCGKTLSVGCGSGLFESILKRDYGIEISNGLEPSTGMADIARKRGLEVEIAAAEDADYGSECWDTILFNGTPSYIGDLKKAVGKSFEALRDGGQIVLIDVPKEGSYGTIYNLAMTLGTWDHPLLEGCSPPDPYPIEFVGEANWRTTGEKISILDECGFGTPDFAQTLTKHPAHSNLEAEAPIPGYASGDYVAIRARKGAAV